MESNIVISDNWSEYKSLSDNGWDLFNVTIKQTLKHELTKIKIKHKTNNCTRIEIISNEYLVLNS